jgi:hypothetical protein
MARTWPNEVPVEQLPLISCEFVGNVTESDEEMHKVPAPGAKLRCSQIKDKSEVGQLTVDHRP